MTGQPPAVELEGAAKRFGSRLALAPLDLRIGHAGTVAVVGPSGSGKTTLLNLVAGSVVPTSGDVRILGDSVSRLPRRVRAARVGLMRQQFDLVPNLSVLHNVLAGNLGRWGFEIGRASCRE